MVEFSDKKFSANGTNAAIDELMNKEGFNKNNAIGSAVITLSPSPVGNSLLISM